MSLSGVDSYQRPLGCSGEVTADDRCDLLCLDVERAEAIRRSRLEPEAARAAAERAHALASPTRLILVCALAQTDDLCVCDLAWIVERPQTSSPIT
jgi:hypothetical protein